MASVLYQPPVMILISARLQKLYHTFNLYDVTSSIAVTVAKAFKSLICMTSCQTYNLYDVISNLFICMTSCYIKKIYLRYMYIIKCIWYGFFNITHRINPQPMRSRALGIILVSRVDTDAILKKPYDILYA